MRHGGLNMLLWPFILSFALALPSQDAPARRPSCIRMTKEKEQQIDLIVEKLSYFLSNLTIEHEHFDIQLIKLSIEQHSDDEEEEKETVLQLSVNDCELTDDELDEIDHHKEKAKEHELERAKEKGAKDMEAKQKDQSNEEKTKKKDTLEKGQEQQPKSEVNNEEELKKDDTEPESKKNFEIMYLDLDENGKKLEKALGKKVKVVYVQKDEGQTDYWFFRRR